MFVLPRKSLIGFVLAQNTSGEVWILAVGEKKTIYTEMTQCCDSQEECEKAFFKVERNLSFDPKVTPNNSAIP